MAFDVKLLDQTGFRRSPWKNGGGVSIAIAEAYRDGASAGDWDGLIWSLSRTAIVTSAPFSDLAGIDRMQVLVEGRGLVLVASGTEIDVREPFRPVSFKGDTPIVSRLEAGPVEVVNLMGNRSTTRLDLQVITPQDRCPLQPGTHVLYAANGACEIACAGHVHMIATGNALRIDTSEVVNLEGRGGRTIVASAFST